MGRELQNIPSGNDGNGYVTVGGRTLSAFRIAKISGQIEMIKDTQRFLENIFEQNAPRGLRGTGNLSYFNKTSALIEAIREYKNTGVYPEITIQYYSNSPQYGRQEVILTGVILDAISFGSLDNSSEAAQILETAFSFDDFDTISSFKE